MLVLGTTNEGKVRELLALLEPYGISCCSLAGLDRAVDVKETGTTFAENAALKASQQAIALGSWVLAEDSGLVVPALGGEPGVRSARFSGAGGTRCEVDDRNSGLLLERLRGLRGPARAAHYACHAALAEPGGRIVAESHGQCHGLIAETPKGSGGFGYDPLFIVPEYHRTFGEIPATVKAMISHRARALRGMLPAIVAAVAGR